ncbi:MAG: Hsp70 family protein [Deltaproteobacteria bacterium]|nr:Hsp70 family protein [Deltaproteobacteria bacterium]
MAKDLYVGIDLGTTNSTAAVFDGEHTELVRNAGGSPLTPSVVRIDARGNVTVGARARKYLETDPNNTRAEFKRLMGTAQALTFAAAGQSRKPEELAAEVLKSLRADARDQLGFEPEQAVISVPALFELPQSSATSEAARLAGLKRADLIQEPVASALAAGWSGPDEQGSWLVYDLGGGTFDVSLLETRDGLLRVIGHDGDNFLGGRDIDWAIVGWALEQLAAGGLRLERSNPAHAPVIRQLKQAAEEAKIELSRAREAPLAIGRVTVAGGTAEVDLTLDRSTLERLALPLFDRSVEVCQRLLGAHGLQPAQVGRIVLVGGPTMMPALRARVRERLGATFAEALDPMALVAQGAAIYAATAGLQARAAAPSASPRARRVWLQYPAMTSDLAPHVVGRLLPGPGAEVATVQLVRGDGEWRSPLTRLSKEGAFVASVEVKAHCPSTFTLKAIGVDGADVPLEPGSVTIVQGLTVSDPPLSRTVGVALANDMVQVYFERGAPLPMRRTFTHRTVDSVAKGSRECLLRIPIVQGEFALAHLCRLVGAIEISGTAVTASLPAGSAVEVTLELDRGGRLSARALVPTLNQVFEEVAHLLVPAASLEVLDQGLADLRARLTEARSAAFRCGDRAGLARLEGVEQTLMQAAQEVAAARGGDADAGQKARRLLTEIDAAIHEAESQASWEELDERVRDHAATAASWVSEYGTAEEQSLFKDALGAIERARGARDARELQRQLRLISNLLNAAYYRHPEAVAWDFEYVASKVAEATNLPQAEELVRQGHAALGRNDKLALKSIVDRLWSLMPPSVEARRRGFDSGLR